MEISILISRIHSLSVGPIHYRISWASKGLPQRNNFASNIDTKEVILGQSDSGNGGGGISFIGVSSSTSTMCHLQAAQQRELILLFLSSVFFLCLGSKSTLVV